MKTKEKIPVGSEYFYVRPAIENIAGTAGAEIEEILEEQRRMGLRIVDVAVETGVDDLLAGIFE